MRRTYARFTMACLRELKCGALILCALPLCLGQTREVQTAVATLRLAEHSGDLVGISWKNPRLEIIAEPRLGENFRLLLPTPGYQAAYFNSREQKVMRPASVVPRS